MNYIDEHDRISKYDKHAYDGNMCRKTFSDCLYSLQEQVQELMEQPLYDDDDRKQDEGLVGVLKRERNRALEECINLIANTHYSYLFSEPKEFDGDPTLAELAEIPTMQEWEERKKNKWGTTQKKRAEANLWKAVKEKHSREEKFKAEEKRQREKYAAQWKKEHPEEAAKWEEKIRQLEQKSLEEIKESERQDA